MALTPGRHAVGSTFHVAGRSLPQKTQIKSSSRTMLCSWQSGHRRNTTSWVKPEGRPSPTSSKARATSDQEVTSGQYPVDWLLTSLTVHRSASRMKLISPALRTMSPPAQATCSLRRGASRLGAAFQNVNFLRDLADDTDRLGRSYLGDTGRLTDADRDAWVQTVREQLADASAAIPLLPHDARAAVRSALSLFSALTDKVARTPVEQLYRTRVRVSDPAKAGLAARAVLTTWREGRA